MPKLSVDVIQTYPIFECHYRKSFPFILSSISVHTQGCPFHEGHLIFPLTRVSTIKVHPGRRKEEKAEGGREGEREGEAIDFQTFSNNTRPLRARANNKIKEPREGKKTRKKDIEKCQHHLLVARGKKRQKGERNERRLEFTRARTTLECKSPFCVHKSHTRARNLTRDLSL